MSINNKFDKSALPPHYFSNDASEIQLSRLDKTDRKIQLFQVKPSQFFLSKWIWGEKYAPIYIQNKQTPLFIKIQHVSQALGIEQSILRKSLEKNVKAIGKIIKAEQQIVRTNLKAIQGIKGSKYLPQPGLSLVCTQAWRNIQEFVKQEKNSTILQIISDLSTQLQPKYASLSLLRTDKTLQTVIKQIAKSDQSLEEISLLRLVIEEPKLYKAVKLHKEKLNDGLLKAILKLKPEDFKKLTDHQKEWQDQLNQLSHLPANEANIILSRMISSSAIDDS